MTKRDLSSFHSLFQVRSDSRAWEKNSRRTHSALVRVSEEFELSGCASVACI